MNVIMIGIVYSFIILMVVLLITLFFVSQLPPGGVFLNISKIGIAIFMVVFPVSRELKLRGFDMYFFKIKYRHFRMYKTLRCKTTISAIFKFLLTLPFSSLKEIEKIKIERLH